MTSFEVLKRQPDFPNIDLSEPNAAQVSYYLQNERGEKPYADFLRASLRTIHITGHQALQVFGVELDYSEDEYFAFCDGFAALEYTSLLVNPQLYNGTIAVRKTQDILVNHSDSADLEIADRYALWLKTHPNTHGVIVDAGAVQGETMKQLHARTIGAHIASELQRAA